MRAGVGGSGLMSTSGTCGLGGPDDGTCPWAPVRAWAPSSALPISPCCSSMHPCALPRQGRKRQLPMGIVSGGEPQVVDKALDDANLGDTFKVGLVPTANVARCFRWPRLRRTAHVPSFLTATAERLSAANGGARGRTPAPPVLTRLSACGAPTGPCQVVVSSKDVEHAKPAPDIYLLAAEKIGVDPGSCVVRLYTHISV